MQCCNVIHYTVFKSTYYLFVETSFCKWFKHFFIDIQTSKELIQMDINIMTNGILQWMVNTHNQKTNIRDLGSSCQANLLESLMNLSVSVIILLLTVKSRLSSPYKRVLRAKGAMCPKAFGSVTLTLTPCCKWNEHGVHIVSA